MSNGLFNNKNQKMKRLSKRLSAIILIIIALLIFTYIGFHLFTEYIWMDSLGFGNVFTTILYSKVFLAAAGFVLFFGLTFLTIYWIRLSYMNHFHHGQLPSMIIQGKLAYPIMGAASVFIGLIGSSIVQGLGWEPALKLLNYTTFNQTDPYFNMDVSFYVFVLPFIEFILYTLLNLFIFFLLAQIGAYSAFHMYRMSRHAQIHLATTFGLIGVFLAGIHLLGRYNTLLTDQVNIFQKSVVHGLSYTDQVINVPKSYVLAAVALGMVVWVIVAVFRGNIKSALKPIIIYMIFIIISQGASVIVQNFLVSPNEFSREEPFLEHNLNFTRAAYDLDDIELKDNPGNDSLDEEMIERNQLTLDNVRLNDSRPLLDIYNQLQTFRTYYKFNDMDIDRYEIDGEYEQVFIGARELSTDNLPQQAQTWVNKNLRYTHGYGIAMSHVNEITKQGQPEYILKNIPSEGEIDVERPQIYYGEEPYP